jgi:hypothetical protein
MGQLSVAADKVSAGFANRVVDCATDGALNGLNNGAACCQLLMRQLMDWQMGWHA